MTVHPSVSPAAGPRSRFVDRDGVRLHVLDWGGAGAPIVLLHGGSAHARWWDFVAPRLTPAGRVFALDLRGHGDSGWAAEGGYRMADYVADLAAVLDSLDLERPILVGHSFGAFVALHHAASHPRALAALVMVDGRASFAESGTRYLKLLGILGPAEFESLERAVEKFRPLPKETIAAPQVLAHVARHGFRRGGSGGWVNKFDRASLAGHAAFDLRPALDTFEFPVLWVRGEHSTVLSRSAAQRLAATCRQGRIVEVPGAHHHLHIDRPERVSQAIAALAAEIFPRA